MNVFNRIAMSLILLVFVCVTLVISLLPQPVMGGLRYALSAAEESMNPTTQLIGAIFGLLIAVGAALLLIAELRPPARQSVVLPQVTGGTAELNNESVALRIKKAAEAIAGIREATPSIRSHGKMVSINLRLVTDPDIDIPQKSEEVMQAVRTETESKMGVPIKTLRVAVKHGSSEHHTPVPEPKPSAGDLFRV